MEVPRPGVESELQLMAYITATAPYPSPVSDLHYSLQQCWILNPLSDTRDQTCIRVDTSQVLNLLSHNRNALLKRVGFVCLFCFFGPYPRHMEVLRLVVQTELQLPAYPTATATPDLSHICGLCHSSWQCLIHSPLSGARNRTHILMDTSRVRFWGTTTRTPM